MKKIILGLILLILSSFACAEEIKTYTLTVDVEHLRNSKGVLQYALYNEAGSLPDEKYTRYMRKQVGEIVNGSSSFTFTNLPEGRYAVNILHDENRDGKIEKGFILPIEGIGFSNYNSIGVANRPNFAGASFNLDSDLKIIVKIIYL